MTAVSSPLVRAGMTPAVRCRYVADLIEAHPDHFHMYTFLGRRDADGEAWDETEIEATEKGQRFDLTACGTVACIAGWAVSVTPADECVGDEIDDIADALLALRGEGLGCHGLFYLFSLTAPEAAFLLRLHANELDRAA